MYFKSGSYNLTALIFCVLLFMMPFTARASDNIFIPEVKSTYVLSADKSGEKVTKIKHYMSMTYRAGRVADNAIAFVFYDDTQTIDKAKAKGAKPVYTKATSQGIFFDDSRICFLNVPLETVGKDVEVTFERTFNRPDFGAFAFLGSIYRIGKLTYTYRMPASLRGIIDVVGRNLPMTAVIDRRLSDDGKEYVITVTASDIPALNIEEKAPSGRLVLPHLLLTGFYRDVNDLYLSMRSYTLATDPDPASVEAKAHEITAGCSDDGSRIEAIHDWVHENIRYVAIEHGDLGNAPDHPSEVLRKRYGDCKGSAALIKAMLRAEGIDGRLVWIGTDDIADDWTDMPLYSTGNHMIAAAVLPDSIIYIDGTVGMADYGVYNQGIQGKQTVIENGDTPLIGRVPMQPAAVNTDSVHIAYVLTDGRLEGSLTETLTGMYKSSLLNALRGSSKTKRDKIISQFIRENRHGLSLKEFSLENDTPGGGPAVISASIVHDGLVKRSGVRHYLSFDLYPGMSDMQVDMKKRTQPVRFNGCKSIRRTASLTVPEAFSVVSLPDDFNIDNKWLTAGITYRLDGSELKTIFSLTVKQRTVALADLPEHNAACAAITKALSQQIILEIDQ